VTICKTVHPMLSDRCPVYLSCLNVLSVTLVYCGQTPTNAGLCRPCHR